MRLFRYVADFPRELRVLPKSIHRVSLVIFLYVTAWGVLDPFLTLYFHDIFGNYTAVALLSALVYFFSIFLSLPFGDLTDIVSKKKLMRIFLILYIPFGFILAMLSTFFQFAVFRVYHAFLATGLWSSAETYVRAHSPPRKTAEAMGYFDSAGALATVIGAFAGGFLMTAFGINALFYLFSIFMIAALFVLPGMPDHHGTPSVWRGVGQLKTAGVFRFEFRDYLRAPGLFHVSLLSFITNTLYFSTFIVLPLFSDKLGANYAETGLIYAAFGIPALFEAPFSVLTRTFNRKVVLSAGGFFSALCLAAAYLADSLLTLFVLSLLISLGLSLLRPVIEGMATELMPRHKVGEFNGVYRSIVLLAAAVGSFVVGPIADKFSIQTPFLLGAVLMTVFLVVVLFSRLPNNSEKL